MRPGSGVKLSERRQRVGRGSEHRERLGTPFSPEDRWHGTPLVQCQRGPRGNCSSWCLGQSFWIRFLAFFFALEKVGRPELQAQVDLELFEAREHRCRQKKPFKTWVFLKIGDPSRWLPSSFPLQPSKKGGSPILRSLRHGHLAHKFGRLSDPSHALPRAPCPGRRTWAWTRSGAAGAVGDAHPKNEASESGWSFRARRKKGYFERHVGTTNGWSTLTNGGWTPPV